MNSVDVAIEESAEDAPPAERITRFVHSVLETMQIDGWELSVVLCGDQQMQNLNREFRDKDESTDVLSFSQLEGVNPPSNNSATLYAGDVVICLPHARRNALQFEVDAEDELKRLIVHGVLHLAGFDHNDNSADQPMLTEQERILLQLKGEQLL
ncbi:MAG: rRNA maturation RNase YbeY [Spirochaetaceae bacterium]|nr:MAG: rRNA maturation RNase YbeY [Spirochaetaceae bacterium]